MWDQSLFELFRKGGWVMWPLLGCSVVGLAIAVDRAIALSRIRLRFEPFVERLRGLVSKRQFEEALRLCRESRSPVALVSRLYLKHREADAALRTVVLQREGSLALERIERRLRGLATVAHLSPLLGLLGTVTGLVSAFHQIELRGGQVQAADLAAGIWEALLTTVFGLIIAIPATAAYHWIERQVDQVARQMQFIAAYCDEWFGRVPQLSPSGRPARKLDDETQMLAE